MWGGYTTPAQTKIKGVFNGIWGVLVITLLDHKIQRVAVGCQKPEIERKHPCVNARKSWPKIERKNIQRLAKGKPSREVGHASDVRARKCVPP